VEEGHPLEEVLIHLGEEEEAVGDLVGEVVSKISSTSIL